MYVNRRMLGALMIVALLATALLGAAGTTWYEGLTASASVATTSLDASVSCSSLSETDPNNNVAPTSAANGTYGWQLTLPGAYAGYALSCNYTITNTAPVAWHVETLTVVVTAPGGGTSSATCTLGASCAYTGTYFDLSIPDTRGCQVHQSPATPSTLTGAFTITFTDAPAASQSWSVKVTYRVQQWNESVYASCGVLRP
ncbi:MAG: hypothetical protein K1X87_05450 [Dehalococcoidia bacterium]|nr:hypothetical protein [Dehalococcoidia bacterium]